MKTSSFKPTGKGPRYGDFNFPGKKGFSDSSGKVRTVGSYTRKVTKRARGGLADLKKVLGSQVSEAEADRVNKATVRPSMTANEAMAMARRIPTFRRTPKIGK